MISDTATKPVCCSAEMEEMMELGRFVELRCGRCGDVVYMKNTSKFI